MTISEASRHALHSRLVEVLGAEEAVALMEYLPPVGWADVATKRDLDHLGIEIRGEIAGLRGEVAELRGEFGELRGEISGVRGEIKGLGGELRQEFGGQLRATYVAMVATMLTTAGTVAAATAITH